MVKNHIDYWQDIKDATMTTINKSKGKYPEAEWKTKLLISEHSPIRKLKINWIWKGIKSWISVHLVRHNIGINHWVSTQRDDRVEIDRNKSTQDTPVNHEIEANAQAIINISRKRLCFQAHKETRQEWTKFLNGIKEYEPELYSVCVPECVYRCGCSEVFGCSYFNEFKKDMIENGIDFSDIQERYKFYRSWSDKNV